MGGDTEQVKERLDIAEVVGGYVKLEKAGVSFKGRCPFHSEKTPSFFVSPVRQSFYCFGCGAKGDIFTFVQELEGLSFREALKLLADRAGVELSYKPEPANLKTEKEKVKGALEAATMFFENELKKSEEARKYLLMRGIKENTISSWRLGYAPAEWRSLYNHLMQTGFSQEILLKAGLVKPVDGTKAKEPYDVFRDRLIFPLSDAGGEVIAFSGRALSKETEPKYLNSPDTILFTKSEVLYGLSKAKEKVRRIDYAILVEGQIDLVLSHQAGVENTVASSGTAFTAQHLERLKRLSKRIILAFDGDKAGEAAGEKAAILALSLGLEVKVAKLPEGKDPADLIKEKPEEWKEILRKSLPAVEHFLGKILEREKDPRKAGKEIERKILPLISLLESAIERSHFISLIAKRTGIKEEVLWEDLKKVKKLDVKSVSSSLETKATAPTDPLSRKEKVAGRLTEVRAWLKEQGGETPEALALKREEKELEDHLAQELLREELGSLMISLSSAESLKDSVLTEEVGKKIQEVHKKLRALEG